MTTLKPPAVWAPKIPLEFDGQLRVPLPDEFEIADEWWDELVERHPGLKIELTPQRELRVAMTSMEGSFATGGVIGPIYNWIHAGGGGLAGDSAVGFDLPSGYRKRPDGCWVSDERLPRVQRPYDRTHEVIPDLIWEIRSPGQSIDQQQEKMVEWIEGGVRLGWLIDPFERKVWIYRANGEVDELNDPSELSGEDVCDGLVVDMSGVW